MILVKNKRKDTIMDMYYDEVIQRKRLQRIVERVSSIIMSNNKYPFIFKCFIIGYKIIKEIKNELYMNVINKLTVEDLITSYHFIYKWETGQLTVKDYGVHIDGIMGGKSCSTCKGRMKGKHEMFSKLIFKRLSQLLPFIFPYPQLNTDKYNTIYYSDNWKCMSFKQMRELIDTLIIELNKGRKGNVPLSQLNGLEEDIETLRGLYRERLDINYVEKQLKEEEERKEELLKKHSKKYYKISKTKLKRSYEYYKDGWSMSKIHKEYLNKSISYQHFTKIFKQFIDDNKDWLD
jgi:hypothetical protein